MAFNFGFDDLVAAESAAGTGANNIIDSYAKRQMDFENLNQALIKNDMDRKIQEMTLPTKIMTENLQNVQKLNVLEPEPTDAHVDQVMEKLFPGQDVKTLNEAQLATVDAQAKALAKMEAPKVDPFDPTSFLKAIGPDVMSDQQRELLLEREKIKAMLEKEQLKVYATALQKRLDREAREAEAEKNRKSRESEGQKNRDATKSNVATREAGQYGRQSLKEAQDIWQAIQAKYGSKRFINSRDRKQLAAQVNSISEPSVRAQAEAMFSHELAKETKTITPPTTMGQAKGTFIKSGYIYKINPDGSASRVGKAK